MDKLANDIKIPGLDGSQTQIKPPEGVPGAEIGIGELASFALGLLFVLAIVLSLFFLLWGGFSWITSGGDPDKIGKARNTLIYAIIGLVVIFVSVFIVQFIGLMLDVDFLANLAKPLTPPDCTGPGPC